MIAAKILAGETAEQIGINQTEYDSRRETLDRYLAQSSGQFDPAGYLAWLGADPVGTRCGASADAVPGPKAWTTSLPSRGFGDTIAKVTRATGLVRITEAYSRVTGRDCGCSRRQTRLNKLLPYKTERV